MKRLNLTKRLPKKLKNGKRIVLNGKVRNRNVHIKIEYLFYIY